RQMELHSQISHLSLQCLGEIFVEKSKDAWPFFHEKHADSKDREHASVFAADDAAADHEHALGDVVHPQDGVRVEHARITEFEARRPKGMGSRGNENEVALEALPPAGLAKFDRMCVGERSCSLIPRHMMALKVGGDALAFALDYQALAGHEVAD